MEFDQKTLRDALGCFATGVTVVTTLSARGPLGMTVNSFASVSLDPPLVLWSPARRSDRFQAFEAASHFAIHVLSANQVKLAEHFAADGLDFKKLHWDRGIGDAPLFDGCTARFECMHSARHDGGDHLIVVGQVLKFETSTLPPLVFHGGKFTRLEG